MNFFIIDSSTFKRLDFLDLEIPTQNRSVIVTDNSKFYCLFNNSFKHLLHSDNNHLNSVTDLVINLGLNLEKDKKQLQKFLKELTNTISERNKLSKKVVENFDYIKDQNNQIIFEIKNLQKNIPSKSDLQQLSIQLAQFNSKKIEVEIKSLINKFELQIKAFDPTLHKVEELLKEVKNIVLG